MSTALLGSVGDAWVEEPEWPVRGVSFLDAAAELLRAPFTEYRDDAPGEGWRPISRPTPDLLSSYGGGVFRSPVAALRLRGGELVFVRVQLRGLSLLEKIVQTPPLMLDLLDRMQRAFEPSRGPQWLRLGVGGHPRPRIPYWHGAFPLGHTWWALDQREHQPGRNFADPERFERLTRGPLPDGWTRQQRGTYWVFDTGVRTNDPVEYLLARGRQHQQLGELLELPRDPKFSQEGDEFVSIGQAHPDPDLYAYLPACPPTLPSHGWVRLPDDEYPSTALQRRLQSMVDAGQTAHGTPIASMGVVVADRGCALACRQVLGQAFRVLYGHPGSGFWDPFPDGGPMGWLPDS